MTFKVPAPPAKPVPAEGMQAAVCCAVVDMGETLNDFPGNPISVERSMRLFFELEEVIPETTQDGTPVDKEIVGKPFMMSTYDIALKSGERSNLRKVLVGMLGKEAPERVIGFDLDSLAGMQVCLNVRHKVREDGSTFAFIKPDCIMRPGPKAAKVERTIFEAPEWVQDVVKENVIAVSTFRGTPLPSDPDIGDGAGGDDEGVPF